jgi:hypothetical protein
LGTEVGVASGDVDFRCARTCVSGLSVSLAGSTSIGDRNGI